MIAASSACFRFLIGDLPVRHLQRGKEEPMEVVVERCAGIDVHKDMVAVCVRVPVPTVSG